ncbi:hypothetical protein O181_016083 [Austropuccinia psidii MF-1]|uniref:Reverse transcriptase domain-containing protein n=1 Tax=Austropuccinia psidii MF-1 TaxID=1389203 RepID=A0A9Q3C4G1_9BASI|nr:hypothetical protein [Austropuccinia psidii MF-1]
MLYKYKIAFQTEKKILGAIIGHEADIILNLDKPYPPLLRRPAYPASPRAREALEINIKNLIYSSFLKKVVHYAQVESTAPVIIIQHNGKSRMVRYFRTPNTYTIPDIYPIPRIHETLTQLSQAKLFTATNALKGFNQDFSTDNSRKRLSIMANVEYIYLLKNAIRYRNSPSHYQRIMKTILPEELSEGWLIIYIDDIIIFSETGENNLTRLERVLKKIVQVNMKISLKKGHFAYSELKELGHVVSELSLDIDKS